MKLVALEEHFKGALINGMAQGKFLDHPCFTPLLARAEKLGVPLYLHPASPPLPVQTAYFSDLEPRLARILSIAGWGWHAEQGLHSCGSERRVYSIGFRTCGSLPEAVDCAEDYVQCLTGMHCLCRMNLYEANQSGSASPFQRFS